MKKHFYSHLIEVDSLHLELDSLDMEEVEREEVRGLIEKNIYHTVLDAILSELSEDDKRLFLSHLAEEDDEKTWNLLNKKVDNIEDKIKQAAEDVKKELHQDIKETRKK